MHFKVVFIAALFGISLAGPALDAVDDVDAASNGLEARGYDDGSWSPNKYDNNKGWDDNKNYGGDDYDNKDDKFGSSYGYGKDQCPSHKDATPFLRQFSPDGMQCDPVIGWFWNYQVCNTIPLYYLFNPWKNDYFYTTKKEEKLKAKDEGYRAYGKAGYVLPDKSCGGVPLYRLYNKEKCRHFYTTSWEEKEEAIKCGYEFECVEGYVYKNRW